MRVKALAWTSSLCEKTQKSMSEETWELKPFDRRKGRPRRTDPDAAFVTHLCESPVREIRTLGLSGGRRSALRGASSDPTPVRSQVSTGKGRTVNVPGVESSWNEHRRPLSPDGETAGGAKAVKPLGSCQRAESFLARTTNKGSRAKVRWVP
jgi:hypothetical protein